MRPIALRAIALSVPLICAWPTAGAAQADPPRADAPPPSRPARVCWRGKPAPACDVFWITELNFEAVVLSTSSRFDPTPTTSLTGEDFDSRLVWTFGPMENRPGNRAIGGTLTIGGSAGGLRVAVEARHRWWSTRGSSLDLSAGIARTELDLAGGYHSAGYGPTAAVLLVGGDLIELTARTDVALGRGRPMAAMSAGVGLGSYAAAGGTVLLAALIGLAFAAFSNFE